MAIYQWLFGAGGDEFLGNFKAGYITGVAVVLTLILLLKLFFFSSKNSVKEVTIPNPDGDLVISSKAIADMVRALVSAKFRHLSVTKINVVKRRDGLALEVIGNFHLDGGNLPCLIDDFRREVFKNLDARLGITEIKKVIPHISKAPATGKTFSSPSSS